MPSAPLTLLWPTLLPPLQVEVEGYFIKQGFLIPAFHKMYWLGGQSSDTKYPVFSWLDRSAGIYPGTYQNWGKLGSLLEPNNAIAPPEYCMLANWTQAYGNPRRWGWSDVNCNMVQATFMCRVQPPVVKYCKAKGTGHDYVLNTNKMSFDGAMGFCNSCGGILVAYDNITEQQDVEKCFIVSVMQATVCVVYLLQHPQAQLRSLAGGWCASRPWLRAHGCFACKLLCASAHLMLWPGSVLPRIHTLWLWKQPGIVTPTICLALVKLPTRAASSAAAPCVSEIL
jgi:hypothetical protein